MTTSFNCAHGGGYGPGKFDRGCDVPRGRFNESGRFGRMMPYLRSLKSFKPASSSVVNCCRSAGSSVTAINSLR